MLTSNAPNFLGAITMATAAGISPGLSPLSTIPLPTQAPAVDPSPGWWRIVLSGVLGINLLLAAGNVGATEPGVNVAASKFIMETVSAGLQMLSDARGDQAQREGLFEALVRQNVDIDRAARFVLGRYWNASTDIERQHFAEVHADYIAHTYAKALPYFSGTTLKVIRTTENGDEIEVKTLFDHDRASRPAFCLATTVYRNEPICRDTDARWDVDWLLHRTGDTFKIVDVDVEGASVLLTERAEFAALIEGAGGTVAGLTRIIEARVAGEPSS
jgi:phospholipid transport system substrate-binding protein